ncbi:TetR/AcrR family transcriptional regulator C-terminal domain-containing protein [Nonomuraea sp. NPDC046570]|uniref:TetR/AcrR family transcriptional regulator n=1 Tax=Nonomuraea sp. NPDC046570 TaxID=3155255 RepID=UPI0033D848CE
MTAAISLLDREGLDALTVRRLADELKVRPMALYNHVSGKADILAAVTEDLVSRLDLPDAGTAGADGLRAVFRSYFRLLIEHPVLLRLDDILEQANPAELKVSEAAYTILERAGLDRRSAVGVLASMLRFTLGCALLYPHRRAWDADPGHWETVRRSMAELPEPEYPTLRAMSTDLPAFTQEEVFEFGLSALLANLGVR